MGDCIGTVDTKLVTDTMILQEQNLVKLEQGTKNLNTIFFINAGSPFGITDNLTGKKYVPHRLIKEQAKFCPKLWAKF